MTTRARAEVPRVRQLTWQTVAVLAVISAVVVALAAFTDWGSTEIIGAAALLAGLGTGGVVGGAVAGGVAQRVDQVHAETIAQTPIMETVARRLDGDLDRRITAGMEATAARVLDELRRQGVIR